MVEAVPTPPDASDTTAVKKAASRKLAEAKDEGTPAEHTTNA
jgi:hypothetical protein